MKQRVLTLLIIVFVIFVSGKTNCQIKDSLRLSPDDFLLIVASNHPIVKKAKLVSLKGDMMLLEARGAFDPKLYSGLNQKYYSNKNYYRILNSGLKIPTWYGIEGKVGFENNTGYNLNPEMSVPPNGLVYSGISINVGKGLFIDQRRKDLKKANLYEQMSEAEQFQLLNSIFLSATKAYWDWVMAYNTFEVYKEAVKLTRERLEGVKKSFKQGAVPAIDTLEAFIQLNDRIYGLNESQFEYNKASLTLSNYIWDESNNPMEITNNLKPPLILDELDKFVKPLSSDSDLEYATDSLMNHPIIRQYELKRQQAIVDKQYYAESLKPKLNLSYHFLNEPIGNRYFMFSPNDYKWGFEFGVPIFLRSERANYKLSKLKILDVEYDLVQKQKELLNKIRSYKMEILNLDQQEKLYTLNTTNYRRLLDAEKRKFRIGESSMFKINSREIKLIDTQVKLVNVRGKYQKALAGYKYVAGQQIFEN